MTLTEQRQIALNTARSYLRKQGINPAQASADDALEALDDCCRLDAQYIASLWYWQASNRQVLLFRREWRRWCVDHLYE